MTDRHTERVAAPTELRNPRTHDLDVLPTLEVLRLVNDEDASVPAAVRAVLPTLAAAVDATVAAIDSGQRVHYFGAGTSGRVAAMDAAELPPTYGIDPSLVTAHQAGGSDALAAALEDVEDDEAAGHTAAAEVGPGDVAVGLTASGRTPYVVGALRSAAAAGAVTVLISSNPDAALGDEVDLHIGMTTGPEAVAGSTRMKAGTAQKMALGAFSTAVMVRLGHTYSNLMIDMTAKNSKLRGRAIGILIEATGQDEATCAAVLAQADGDSRAALVALLTGTDVTRAADALARSAGSIHRALNDLGHAPPHSTTPTASTGPAPTEAAPTEAAPTETGSTP